MADALKRAAGLKGGPARAKSLSSEKRSHIASVGGLARSRSLTRARRAEIARLAASMRWAK